MAMANKVMTERPAARSRKTSLQPAPAAGRTILFQNENSLIEFIRGDMPSNRLAVTFAPPALCDVNGFGYYEDRLRTEGFDVLAIKQASDMGYADLTAETIATVCDQIPQYQSVTVLGTEAGATAALRLFSAFSNVTILAVSPDMTVDCALAKPVQAQITMIYDPCVPAQVENFQQASSLFSRATVFKTPHTGSPARYSLEESGTLVALVIAMGEGTILDVNRHFRANRHLSATALYVLGNDALTKRQLPAARRLLKRSYEVENRPEIGIAYCHTLRESGAPLDAVAFMKTIVDRYHHNAHLWAALSYFQEMADEREEALMSIRHAIELQPQVEPFLVAERRLLNDLFDDLRMKQMMTEAALNKSRAEFALAQGHGSTEFSWERATMLAVGSLLILVTLAAVAISFRLV
ncbi:MAG: hypothetical protein AABZ76_20935 [Pseudomonadota bacterium]|jgi:tetratricopeptide (TPR) repeat protein|uniref:tetratricopeptide repeat protein n=1 Tax=Sphingobium yanoikuyae TaxID=13690 RepID=UPI001377BAE6|nr:hypothetical protein [Sphingobium yanoikuyae]NBB39695.1 hypothetical protein [Sphingobium yanoikuyae]